jgi:hypothetical protein
MACGVDRYRDDIGPTRHLAPEEKPATLEEMTG